MDLSKLPKMSKTPTPPPPDSTAPASIPSPASRVTCPQCAAPLRAGARFCDACGTPLRVAGPAPKIAIAAETFISIAVGVLLLLFVPFFKRSLEYYFTRNHPGSFSWSFNDVNGNPLPYPQTAFFLPDIGLTAFAFALILEGILMIFWNRFRALLFVAIAISLSVVIFNVAAMAKTYSQSDMLEKFLSAIVIAFGGYAALYQFALLRSPGGE